MSPFDIDPVLTATREQHAFAHSDGTSSSHGPSPTHSGMPHRQYNYADLFGMSPIGHEFVPLHHQQHTSTSGGPSPVSANVPLEYPHHHGPQPLAQQNLAVAASDSSAGSSPDIASLLPPRHRWGSPSSLAMTQQLPHTPTAPSAHSLPSTSSPIRSAHAAPPASAPGSWYGLDGYGHLPTGADVNALASEWARHDFNPSAGAVDNRTDHLRHLPFPQMAGLAHFYSNTAQQPQPHAARHHPYMSPESSLAVRHRALGELSNPNHSNAVEPPRPIKSGRLGVKRRQKYTRSRTGCLGCRARRIKCDEGRPVCRRCVVAKRESDCIFPEQSEGGSGKSGRACKSESGDEDMSSPELSKKLLTPEEQYAALHFRRAHARSESGEGVKVESTSVGPSPHLGGVGGVELAFDLTSAIPEGLGIGPLGWDRAFTSGGLSPSAFGLDGTGSANNSGHSSALGFIGDMSRQSSNPNPNLHQMQAHQHQHQVNGNGAIAQSNGEDRERIVAAPPLLTTPNPLSPWFPTMQEQSLILHYCVNATDLMIAIPDGLSPMLAVNLPLALASPRGSNVACDALRTTLLGIGAVHMAFLQAKANVSTATTTAMFQYAANLRDLGKEKVRLASSAAGGASTSDAALAAATSLATIDIFFGGQGWEDNFALAKRIVSARGGPRAMLQASPLSLLEDGTTVTPARLSLEILAIYDTFACLTMGDEPELLTDKESWWFESSGSTFEEHSVETQFGMSRTMVYLFSRVARLLARVHKAGVGYLDEPPAVLVGPAESAIPGPTGGAASRRGSWAGPSSRRGSAATSQSRRESIADAKFAWGRRRSAETGSSKPPPGLFATSNPFSPSSSRFFLDPSTIGSAEDGKADLTAEAGCLKLDIDAWIESLGSQNKVYEPDGRRDERIQVGNKAYAYAMRILLLRMVFGRRRTDPLVQRSALEVMHYCSVSTAKLCMSIDLMWPAVVAGCCLGPDNRPWLSTLLEGFKAQCCFDVETASRIILEVWRRVDDGDESADWKVACDDLGLKVLLC